LGSQEVLFPGIPIGIRTKLKKSSGKQPAPSAELLPVQEGKKKKENGLLNSGGNLRGRRRRKGGSDRVGNSSFYVPENWTERDRRNDEPNKANGGEKKWIRKKIEQNGRRQ